MATSYILALDQGTTSSRSILFDHQGNIAGIAQRETLQISPQQDWAEQDAEDILKTLIATAAEVIAMTGITGEQIEAVGIANQRETIVVWDRITGKPLYHAITSHDKRTARYCQKLKESVYSKGIHSMTGLVINTTFSASKIKWVLDHVLGAREKAKKGELAFGTIDSWIVWNLTNGALHVTDVSNASRTLLLDIKTCQWNEELLDLFTIPRSMTPDVRSSSEVYGTSEKIIPGYSIPIAGIAGNQQAALLGQMCIRPGQTKNTCENDSCVMMNTGADLLYSKNDLTSTVAWRIGNKVEYALEGNVLMKEMEISWWREALMHLALPDETNTVSQLRNSDEVYVVPAGACSHELDNTTCVSVFGLTSRTTEAQLSAAVLDSIAYQCYSIIKTMEMDAGHEIKELRIDGAAVLNDSFLQFLSDILDIDLIRSGVIQSSALGAAYLAGLAVGFWDSFEDIQQRRQIEDRFVPSMDMEGRNRLLKGWKKALLAARIWTQHSY